MASILLSSTVEHEYDTRKQNINRQTSSHKWTFLQHCSFISFHLDSNSFNYFGWQKIQFCQIFFRSHKLQSKCLPEGMNIFMYFKHLLCFLWLRLKVHCFFFIRQKDQSFKITGRCFRKAAVVGQEPGMLSGWRNLAPLVLKQRKNQQLAGV